MAYRDLRDFLRKLEKEGELKRLSAEVDPVLEITEISDRTVKRGGPALLFERTKGSRFAAVTNMVGTERRMNLALEVDSLNEIAGRISSILDMQSPQGILDKVKMLPKLAELGSVFPKTVRNGECQDVVRTDGFSLLDFPILQCWPQDGGRYITWPMVITKNPETGKRNVGCYRMQVFDSRTTGMHWQTQKHGAEHYRSALSRNRGGKLEVAVAIGADPATCFSRDFACAARYGRIHVFRLSAARACRTGGVQDGRSRGSGECRNRAGRVRRIWEKRVRRALSATTRAFIRSKANTRCSTCTCVTHRKDPLYLTTIVGPPPQEDYFIGHAIERVFLPVMKMQHPEIVDVAMPAEGIFQNLMIVAIRKSYPGHARKTMNAIWSLGQAMFTKVVVIVDHDVNVQDPREVVWKALCAIDPERDIQFVLGPVDTLDHAARRQDFGSKMGIDATRKWPEEGYTGRWPDEIKMDSATKKRIDELWAKLKLDR